MLLHVLLRLSAPKCDSTINVKFVEAYARILRDRLLAHKGVGLIYLREIRNVGIFNGHVYREQVSHIRSDPEVVVHVSFNLDLLEEVLLFIPVESLD